ncbi:hypothetical protein [Leisingera sp. F5]|uniref:hypothetical protein n=1 Tax=Leisingera sp. F5 TaxID=1813816 RepID=UPI000AEBDBAB|nr:hypothetical protein [Leisingera sp. F5]
MFFNKLIDHHSRIVERAKRLRTVPGVGPISASAITALIVWATFASEQKYRHPAA